MAKTYRELPEKERPLSEQFRLIGKRWVVLEAAFNALERGKTTKLAMLKQELIVESRVGSGKALTDAAAERLAKNTPEWQDYLKGMDDIEEEKLDLKNQLDAIRIANSERIDAHANARKELDL